MMYFLYALLFIFVMWLIGFMALVFLAVMAAYQEKKEGL